MANIKIAGGCYVVTSTVSMADLELVEKLRPSVLTLADEQTKEPYFKVAIGSNSLSDHGISFGGVSNDGRNMATVTLPIPADVEDAKAYVAEKVGVAVVNLNRIEACIGNVLEEIQGEHKKVMESIKIVA